MKTLLPLLCLTFLVSIAPAKESSCLPKYKFDGKKLILTEKEWKEKLTPEQFDILRKGKKEIAFNNLYYDAKEVGIYRCAGCDLPLFSSETKYNSGAGFPTFWAPLCQENVLTQDTFGWFSDQVKVSCSRCDGHLGYLFQDGPLPSGKRYTIYSGALKFSP